MTKKTKKQASESLETPVKLSRFQHPYVVLFISILLPGVGQVINRTPGRGLLMVFFILVLGMITYNTTTPEHSMIGRFAGGLFIYAISIIDAYRWARYRWEFSKKVNP